MERQEKTVRTAIHVGSGMAIGAALGLLFGAMLLPNASLGGLAGVVIGLLIGAIVDVQTRKRGVRDQ